MKKIICVWFMTLCLTLALPLTGSMMNVKAASPTTWIVDNNGLWNFTRIQDAIDSPQVNAGDTIIVHNGIYLENVVVNKTLSLIGENAESTIIDGRTTGSVVSIQANSVTFVGFMVRRSGAEPGSAGISIANYNGATIANNTVVTNNNGISLSFSNYDVISNNNISSNANNGVLAYFSSGNTFDNNIIADTFLNGIYFSSSSQNIVSANTISNSSNGYGIILSFSGNNTLFHNNFNNPRQVSTESTNAWDYGNEGNYWSDYAGRDLNGDGIGDYPYIIDADNQDDYPLMGAFSDFSVTFRAVTYHILTISNSTIDELAFEIGTETGNKIVQFNATDQSGTAGFCRIALPTSLMEYPYILLIDSGEMTPTLLGPSNQTIARLYFTYPHENRTIRIISSITLSLYTQLQADFTSLNLTYYTLLTAYNDLLGNYTQLNDSFVALNASYQQLSGLNTSYYQLLDVYNTLNQSYQQLFSLNSSYYQLLNNYGVLQDGLAGLNSSYLLLQGNYAILSTGLSALNLTYLDLSSNYVVLQTVFTTVNASYSILLSNYTQLQRDYNSLNQSYQNHLSGDADQAQNLRSLIYIVVAMATIVVIVTVYLSRRARSSSSKFSRFEDKKTAGPPPAS